MENKKKRLTGLPPKQGLYDPAFEHDACGVGFIVDIHGRKSHAIVKDALTILLNLDHRGAVGAEHNTGDGAGILTQMPDKFLRRVCAEQGIHLPELGKYGAGVVFSSPEEAEAKAQAALEERRRVEAENRRKQEQYDEQVKAAQKRVRDLNNRFADWYYVVSDKEYDKIHLDRAGMIQKKSADEKKD